MGITDHRLFLVSWGRLAFQLYYDPDFVRQMALEERRNLDQKRQTAGQVHILIGAELKKGLVGGEYLLLSSHLVDLVSFRRKFIGLMANRNLKYDLHLLKPWTLSAVATTATVSAAVLPFAAFLAPVVAAAKQNPNMPYQPILDIVRAKATELSTLTKELENTKA